ncbi:TetR/AcrR family transcriptional regulator [Nocardia sp. CDC159]|uniref:TetR/AcrR family transcriptional regulator n=1 Tax=Nocardia pulmonis TaxID=2951408 RepID=A0A9X2E7B0_9NOCA|nr:MULTISPECIES: TetR/AcrR family transcriptional regulator [Nocardia]MCM6774180.1 TetR/AcrR family transcriptional regulator [Nocardia pulmonis]MCM6787067.1 TetR/AcrR family transcriptional regulator [Nocardia sp. CDC159]
MPRLVDHEVRRQQIIGAVRRVIVTGGLAAVTFQSVAAEAGVSVRLVQYYFGTKREFLLATHRSVMDDAGNRFLKRWTALGDDATPREAIRAVLLEVLPLDEQRREETIILGAFNTAAISGQGITAAETLTAPNALVALVADQLRKARHRNEPTPSPEPDLDAKLIGAAVGGLAQGMLTGYATAEAAIQLLDHLLDRVLGKAAEGQSNRPRRAES